MQRRYFGYTNDRILCSVYTLFTPGIESYAVDTLFTPGVESYHQLLSFSFRFYVFDV